MLYGEKIHIILSKLYQLRVMSYNDIYSFIFGSEGLSESYCQKILKNIVKCNYVEKVGRFTDSSYYFLKRDGIKFLKTYGVIPIGKKKVDDAIFFSEFLYPSRLKVEEIYVNHQLSLNHFVLRFEQMFSGFDFSYYDEIHVSSFIPNVRPDGLIKINNNCYFLEMDMGTERKSRLMSKWESYRNFLNSNVGSSFDYNIEMLFILGGKQKSYGRRSWIIRKYLSDFLEDKINFDFNVKLDTENNLLNNINNDLRENVLIDYKQIFSPHGFNFISDCKNSEFLSGFIFDKYICKLNQNKKIVTNSGFVLDFYVDNFTDGNMYVYKKVKEFNMIASCYSLQKKRNIHYLIITNSESEAYTLLKNDNAFYDGLYFTTINRLSSLPFYEAVFTLDSMGTVYHFTSLSFDSSIAEPIKLESLL